MEATNSIRDLCSGTFCVKAKTRMPETKITAWDGRVLKMDVHAAPENGAANIEIIKYLKKLTNKNAKILRGVKNSTKLIKIE
ncbi:MAG: DUF167 family protein [Candidatus Woesearchaeota archaeon]